MYSSEDLERFYFLYKTEALPHGVSIQEFCVRNKFSNSANRGDKAALPFWDDMPLFYISNRQHS